MHKRHEARIASVAVATDGCWFLRTENGTFIPSTRKEVRALARSTRKRGRKRRK